MEEAKAKRIKLEDVAPEVVLEEVQLEEVELEDMVLEESIKLEDEAPDMVLEEVQLEELMRAALMSSLPLLKSKVKIYANLKEERLKEKVDKLEKELIEKDDKLRQIEGESSSQFDELVKCRSLLHSANDQISKKDEELRMDNLEMDNLENQLAERDKALNSLLEEYDLIVVSENGTEKYYKCEIKAQKLQLKSQMLAYRLLARGESLLEVVKKAATSRSSSSRTFSSSLFCDNFCSSLQHFSSL